MIIINNYLIKFVTNLFGPSFPLRFIFVKRAVMRFPGLNQPCEVFTAGRLTDGGGDNLEMGCQLDPLLRSDSPNRR